MIHNKPFSVKFSFKKKIEGQLIMCSTIREIFYEEFDSKINRIVEEIGNKEGAEFVKWELIK